jgi:hypothetical protein
MGLITSHRTYLTIKKTRKGRPRPDPGCSATDDDDDGSFLQDSEFLFITHSETKFCTHVLLKYVETGFMSFKWTLGKHGVKVWTRLNWQAIEITIMNLQIVQGPAEKTDIFMLSSI